MCGRNTVRHALSLQAMGPLDAFGRESFPFLLGVSLTIYPYVHKHRPDRRRKHHRDARPGGPGDFGSKHLGNLRHERCERRAALREYGGRGFQGFEAFLAHRPMDLVVIGSPSGLHAAEGIAAAKRGLHVLTEKPIDISTKRADALIEATRTSRVKLGVIFQDRVKPDIRRLKKWLAQGALGKVLFVDAKVNWYRPPEYYGKSKWRGTLALDGGGALMNQGVHTVDLLLWLLGDVTRVQARTATALHQNRIRRYCGCYP